MEIYASSRSQDGRTSNEDAFLIGRSPVDHAVLCDGSGAAGRVGNRALQVFGKLVGEVPPEGLQRFETWAHWTRLLDSALLGGPQSTFLAVACLGHRVVGVCAGDSRLYHLDQAGKPVIVTEAASKARLGSGKVDPFPIHLRTHPGDVLLLMSDGAWTPLNLAALQRLWARSLGRHFTEFPSMILDESGKAGRADDMTVIAVKV